MQTEKHTFHQIFERIVQEYPNNTALVNTNEKNEQNNILYSQLNNKANQLAHYLLEKGNMNGKKIAIFVNEIRYFIINILAVHKIGAVYIPISLYENNEVISDTLAKSQPDVCIFPQETPRISEAIHKQFPNTSIINLEEIEIILSEKNTCNPATSEKVRVEDDAYIMFTSGSSGKPKGAVLKHSGLPLCLRAHQEIFEITSDDHILQLAKVGFDASLMEIMMALGTGATLYIVSPNIRDDNEKLRDFLSINNISIAIFVPSKLHSLAKKMHHPSELSNLRGIVVTGEPFSAEIIKPWIIQKKLTNKLRTIVNGYGLTETTICVSLGKFNGTDLTIGKPIPGTKAHLLTITDETYHNLTNLTPAVRGCDAELYVSGNSITVGYINDPEHTKKHLVNITDHDTNNTITAFRTRDCVKYAQTSDELIYICRLDNQIKLRGQRLDPEHIEAQIKRFCINQKPIIQDVRVVCIEQDGHKHLVAFLLPHDAENHPHVQEVHQHLKKILPVFMVPNAMEWLQQFPLSANGKSARQALMQLRPIPFIRSRNELTVNNEIESKLAEIWKNLLGITNYNIKRDDDFFCLGGSSILIGDLLTQIRTQQSYFLFSENCTAEQIYFFSSLKMMAKSLVQAPLRKLHEGDQKQTPVILVHSLLGDGWTEYQKLSEGLAKKFPENSIYALRGNIGTTRNYLDTSESLEELASFYANIINLSLKVNNIILIGWSSGGLIAFAITKHLEQLNTSTHLFLLDSDTPEQIRDNALSTEYFTNIRALFVTKERSVQQFAEWLLAAETRYAKNVIENKIKIQSNIYSLEIENHHKWNEYTFGEYKDYTIQTNHFDIINDASCFAKICDEIKKIKSFKFISQIIAAIKSHHTIPIKMEYLLDRSKSWELHALSHIPLNLINADQKYISIRIKFDEALSKIRDMFQKVNAAWISEQKSIFIAGVSDDECHSWCTVISEDLKKAGFDAKKKYNHAQNVNKLRNYNHDQAYVSLLPIRTSLSIFLSSYQLIISHTVPEKDKDYISFTTKNYYTSLLTLLLKLLSLLDIKESKDLIFNYLQLIDELRINLNNNHEILLPDEPLPFYESLLNYEIFKPEKILIEGSAGSGKTLLLKFLAQQWALGTLWKNQFDCIIHLFARNFLEECKLNNAIEFTLAHAIYYRYFGYSINEKKLAKIQLLLDSNCKLLLLLDGLEEIESAFLSNPRLRRFANEISSLPYALVTARPDRSSTVVFKHVAKTLGFSAGAINRYIETYFQDNPKEATELEQCIETHLALREICHIPISLELICSLWKMDKAFFTTANVTITNIYQKVYSELINYHWQLNLERIADNNIQSKFPHIKQAVIKCLEKVAFINASLGNSAIIAGKIWHQAYTEISAENDKELDVHIASARFNPGLSATFNLLKLSNNQWFINVHNSGLLNQVIAGQDLKNISYEFIHSRFQDFATANYLAACIELQCKQQVDKCIEEFIQTHLYSIGYEYIWIFLSGLLKSIDSKNWFFEHFNNSLNTQMSIEKLAFKLKCLNEVEIADDAPVKRDAVTQFKLLLKTSLKKNEDFTSIDDCRRILLQSPFLLNEPTITLTIIQEPESAKTQFLSNWFPKLQLNIFKQKFLQYDSTKPETTKSKYNILILGKTSHGKSSLINTLYSSLSSTTNFSEHRFGPQTKQISPYSLRFYDMPGLSDHRINDLDSFLQGEQQLESCNNRVVDLSAIQHPLAEVRAKFVMRLNDENILSVQATKALMAVAFGDINYGVRDLAIEILEQRSLKSQYLSLMNAFDVLLSMNLPTQFWVKFFEAKPEYLQYCIAHCEDDSAKKAKLFCLLSEAAHQSIQVYKSISYLTFRFKMASELMQELSKDVYFVEQACLTPVDESLKELVNTRIFENALAHIRKPSSLPGPAFSDNPNTFFPTIKSQAKKNKALQDKKEKEKTNTRYESKYGNKGKIFQP